MPMPDYVHGGIKGKAVGYHHISTREAYQILYQQVNRHVDECEADIARTMSNCCLSRKQDLVESKETKLALLKEIRQLVSERSKAKSPVGNLGLQGKVSVGNEQYYSNDGAWFSPAGMFEAGGGK